MENHLELGQQRAAPGDSHALSACRVFECNFKPFVHHSLEKFGTCFIEATASVCKKPTNPQTKTNKTSPLASTICLYK